MCDPLTIAGVALSGVSTALNAAAQSKIQGARDDAMAAERIRQKGLDQEADALNTTSRDRYQNFEGQQADKSAQLGDYFTGQEVAQPSAEAALPTTSSNITVQEVNKQKGQAKDFTNRTGTALGELRSFGDLLGDVSRLQARDAGSIGQIGSFKKGSSAVLPYELEAANSKGGGLKLFGDILGGLGGIATSAGLSGGSLFGLGGAKASAVSPGFGASGMAAARALDRASVPGYAGVSSLYGAR
ncbi:hypothetical protein [Rhizobium phaseoli]|uniref:hypothetical protein n=1 Tax=Rhizobium phaseoli TaxID=396 RepID=UPI002555E165|nr:hypothetical protein [Rhizobium phaseoli]MDK4729335.1 hypothetical protein [Rhizobium phaseoli]